MSQELQTSGQFTTLSLWGSPICYDKKVVQLKEFSTFLEQRAKKSAEDFLLIGQQQKMGWLIAGTDFLEKEMRQVCSEVGEYITAHNILDNPNWELFLQPKIMFADAAKQLTLNLHDTLVAACINNMEEQAQQAYRNSLANSEGLGFGIISNSLTAHFLYAMQAAQKDRENEQAAQDAANRVRRNSSPVEKAGELTAKAYHETHEPYVIDSLAQFYGEVESFIYTGADYDKTRLDVLAKEAVETIDAANGADIQGAVVQALQKDVCCGEAVFAAIRYGLVDDDFIKFCFYAPLKLLKNSVKPITAWLKKEKHTNQLYNRPIFSEKIRHFLADVQKVFLHDDVKKSNLYDRILDSAFADEINSIYTTFNDLCHFNDVILKKYANDGTHISISSGTIGLLITLCNEIHSGRLINLVNSSGLIPPIEDGQIKILIETANSAIDRCYAEIEQARYEAAKQAAAAKAEQERIDAEQFAKQQAEKEAQQKETIRKIKIAAIIFTPIVAVVLLFALWLWPDVIHPSMEYNSAVSLMEQGKYSEAIVTLNSLPDYKDSADLLLVAKYSNGQQLMQEENYSEAISQFSELGAYKDSQELIREAKYEIALEKLSSGNDDEALELLAEARPYGNSEQYLSEYRFVLTSMEDYLPDYGIYSEEYDENGRVVSHTTRDGVTFTTEYTYDASGNVVSKETSDNHIEYFYEASNDTHIEYFYNQDNQLICQHKTKIEYSSWETKYLDEPYWVEFFEYDGNGNLIHDYTWYVPDHNPPGISMIEYEYDADNHCTAETYYRYNTSGIEYVLDGDNWLYNIANMQYLDDDTKFQIQSMGKEIISQTKYTYNSGLLIEKNYVHRDGFKYDTTYYYENGLLVQEVMHPSGKIYNYYYDDFGNLIREEDSDGAWTAYTYTAVFDGERP